MSTTYRGGGYEVTVNTDKSIVVRQGDWLSKYSMAIYGDFEHIKKFKKKVGSQFQDIPNPDLIRTGEILYHPDPLPGEIGISPVKPEPEDSEELDAGRLAEFLQWVKMRFLVTDWIVDGTGGGDLSFSFVSGQYATINVKNGSAGIDEWLHALAGGLTIGYPDSAFGGSFAVTQFPSAGTILRSPLYPKLTLNDFVGGVLVLEVGGSLVVGGALSLVFFGMGFPPSRLLAAFEEFLSGNADLNTFLTLFGKASPSGVAILLGGTIGIPGVSATGRVGYMSYF